MFSQVRKRFFKLINEVPSGFAVTETVHEIKDDGFLVGKCFCREVNAIDHNEREYYRWPSALLLFFLMRCPIRLDQ